MMMLHRPSRRENKSTAQSPIIKGISAIPGEHLGRTPQTAGMAFSLFRRLASHESAPALQAGRQTPDPRGDVARERFADPGTRTRDGRGPYGPARRDSPCRGIVSVTGPPSRLTGRSGLGGSHPLAPRGLRAVRTGRRRRVSRRPGRLPRRRCPRRRAARPTRPAPSPSSSPSTA
jgi:hypothetical protein